jgi:hypothetical protein
LSTTCTGNNTQFDLGLTKDGLFTSIDDLYNNMIRIAII